MTIEMFKFATCFIRNGNNPEVLQKRTKSCNRPTSIFALEANANYFSSDAFVLHT